MQVETDESPEQEEVDLVVLARRLRVLGMPVQRVIGEETGVSQSTVSRASAGTIGQTPGARKLWRYAEDRLAVLGLGDTGEAGGPPPVEPKTAPVSRRRRERRLADETGRALDPVDDAAREELERQALCGLREYLEDRFDPLLVIEQLAMLRRAQDGGRQARPSRRSGEAHKVK